MVVEFAGDSNDNSQRGGGVDGSRIEEDEGRLCT
jgi:hypothetical protein